MNPDAQRPPAATLPPDRGGCGACTPTGARGELPLGRQDLPLGNPLLREPLRQEHVKHRLLGHWGASPACPSSTRTSTASSARTSSIFMAGPGHGAPGVLGPAYLEGTYSEVYPDKSLDEEGLRRFFKQFSFPGGIGSHCTPEMPGSIHEGGELGYVLSHACGAAFDNPDLIVAAVVGDGESETGPLATSWHVNKFLNPIRDGAVLPVLSSTATRSRPYPALAHPDGRAHEPVARLRVDAVLRGRLRPGVDAPGHGRHPRPLRRGHPRRTGRGAAHGPRGPAALADDRAARPEGVDGAARARRPPARGLVARPPGAHPGLKQNPARLELLERWLRSYRPEELFDAAGAPVASIRAGTPGRPPDGREPARQRRPS